MNWHGAVFQQSGLSPLDTTTQDVILMVTSNSQAPDPAPVPAQPPIFPYAAILAMVLALFAISVTVLLVVRMFMSVSCEQVFILKVRMRKK